ncbi:MAG: transcription initiation factor IIB [Candidatus Nitrosopolaris wilkensis]|nr:MAG: transcription initiation factor IIB [Candidatus Nitrosopolaris wilkensis]
MLAHYNASNKSSSNHATTAVSTPLAKCPSCSNEKIITDSESGEIICVKCGRVISDKLQEIGPEWRTFSTDETEAMTRTGIPQSLARHDMGLSTIIGRTDRDASGNKLDAAMRTTMNRLATWDMRSQLHTPKDRGLRQAFFQLDVLKDKLGLSDSILEKTAYIYRKAQSRKITRGRTVSGVLAAAVYIACREMGAHRTLDDIATACNVKRKELSKDFRVLHTRLDLKIPQQDPMKCIAKVASKAKLSEKTKRQAAQIMSSVTREEISAGKDPMGLAASVLYLSSIKNGETITQSNIAEAAGVTEVTVRNRAKELRKKLEFN